MSFTNICYVLFLGSKYSPQHSTPTPHTLNLCSYLKMCPGLGSCVRNTNRNSTVSIVTRLRTGQSGDWFPTGKRIFSERLTSPTSLLLNRWSEFCPRGLSGRSVKLITSTYCFGQECGKPYLYSRNMPSWHINAILFRDCFQTTKINFLNNRSCPHVPRCSGNSRQPE
jgi:hypothetical protein